jgi:murein DD-endopeptidase MepM/ murein hydrolase activator NlpD
MKTLLVYCLVCLPLKHLQLSSSYGYRIHPLTGKYAFHAGVDLRARHDTVFAVMNGLTETVGYDDFLGINIRLAHDNLETIYGHLSQVFVSPGQPVEAGEPIGITGATGRVTGEHLHFSVRFGNRYIDPFEFIYQNLINNRNHE